MRTLSDNFQPDSLACFLHLCNYYSVYIFNKSCVIYCVCMYSVSYSVYSVVIDMVQS